jgi:hypothetical protein
LPELESKFSTGSGPRVDMTILDFICRQNRHQFIYATASFITVAALGSTWIILRPPGLGQATGWLGAAGAG